MLFDSAANTFKGWRSIGGRVTVTDQRLLFTPNRLDGLTGARRLSIERASITRVWTEDPGREGVRKRGLAAAVRPQIGFDHPGGPTFLTVYHPKQLLDAVQANAR